MSEFETVAELAIFENEEFGQVRVVDGPDGNPWFVARDVTLCRGYQDPANAVQRHCKKANDFNIGVSPRVPSPRIIPESDVYRLVMRSNLPKAEEFQSWVFEDVLPSIRKRGAYITKDAWLAELCKPENIAKLMSDFDKHRDELMEARKQIEELAPKARLADHLTENGTTFTLAQVAQITCLSVGQLRDMLLDNQVMYRKVGGTTPGPYMPIKLWFACHYAIKVGLSFSFTRIGVLLILEIMSRHPEFKKEEHLGKALASLGVKQELLRPLTSEFFWVAQVVLKNKKMRVQTDDEYEFFQQRAMIQEQKDALDDGFDVFEIEKALDAALDDTFDDVDPFGFLDEKPKKRSRKGIVYS